MSVKQPLANRLAAALVALALAVLGFAHSTAPAAPSDPMMAAYLQAGGVLDDLCVADPGNSDHNLYQDCPVCALTKAFALAASTTAPRPGTRLVAMPLPHAVAPLTAGHTPRAPPARGPPASFV